MAAVRKKKFSMSDIKNKVIKGALGNIEIYDSPKMGHKEFLVRQE